MKKIILKYSQNDNIATTDMDRGWVDAFADFLRISLPKFAHNNFEIQLFTENQEIELSDFQQASIILYILSPAFIFSSNLNQEIPELEKGLDFDIHLINQKVRKVVKAPFSENDLPISLKVGPSYAFYRYTNEDFSSYESFEGWSEFSENLSFWQIFTDLMVDIAPRLQDTLIETPRTNKKVYLAVADVQTFKAEREGIKRELRSHGIQILPDEDYSVEVSYLNDPDSFYLERSVMAIHFPDEFLPIDKQENRDKLDKYPNLKRIIWFDPEAQSDVNRHKAYTDLKINLKSYNNIEAIESPIEELKDIIKEKFNLGFKAAMKKNIQFEDLPSKLFYVISSQGQRDIQYQEMCTKIKTLGWNIVENIAESNDITNFKLRHYHYIKHADYFLIYYDSNNLNWLESNIKEIVKAPGMSRTKPVLGRGIYTDLPPIFTDLTYGGFSFVNSDGSLGAITLEEFIKPELL